MTVSRALATQVLPTDPPHLKAAFSKLGLKEITGAKHEKQILEMYAACGHRVSNDETAWCAAFVGWCLAEAGLPNTHSLMARSYAKYGRALNKSKPVPRGAIAVWPRGAPPSGHVNFVLSDDGTYLTCIGGNQSKSGTNGAVTISRTLKSELVAVVMPLLAKAPPEPDPIPEPQPALQDDPEPDDTKPHAAPPDAPKSGITEGAKVGAGLGFAGLLTQVWEVIASAPETILQAGIAAVQKPAFLIFAAVICVGGYIWWRRNNMKKAA